MKLKLAILSCGLFLSAALVYGFRTGLVQKATSCSCCSCGSEGAVEPTTSLIALNSETACSGDNCSCERPKA